MRCTPGTFAVPSARSNTVTTVRARDLGEVLTFLAIAGPGLIVMVADNNAGAFGTSTQAGQDYGTSLLWMMLLMVPVLFVNQGMVLRLGAVTGVGHARLILERFGRFWGAFSVIDLFLLNSAAGSCASAAAAIISAVVHNPNERFDRATKLAWRMPPLATLPKGVLTPFNRLWLVVLRFYLVGSVALVIVRVTQIDIHHGSL